MSIDNVLVEIDRLGKIIAELQSRIADLEQRRDELQASNNALLERARKAEIDKDMTEKILGGSLYSARRKLELRAESAEAERDTALAQVAALRRALRPFAAIKPSCLYHKSGIEEECYIVLLQEEWENPRAFTGKDLARARAALAATEEMEA